MAHEVQDNDTPSIPLANLAANLARALPVLQGASLEQLLLEGIRAHAGDQPSPMRFWARFILELGRQGPSGYDLLGQADPAAVRLNAVQVSFMLRRLTGDVLAFSGAAKKSAVLPTQFLAFHGYLLGKKILTERAHRKSAL